jgi:hypothetical protein
MLCEPMTPLFVGDFFNAIDPKRTAAKVCPDHRAHTSGQTSLAGEQLRNLAINGLAGPVLRSSVKPRGAAFSNF